MNNDSNVSTARRKKQNVPALLHFRSNVKIQCFGGNIKFNFKSSLHIIIIIIMKTRRNY